MVTFTTSQLYRAVRLGNPSFVRAKKLGIQAVDALGRLPFLSSDETIQSRKTELPAHTVVCSNIQEDVDIFNWWRRQVHLPKWQMAGHRILHAILCSSRVSSLSPKCNEIAKLFVGGPALNQ